MSDLRVLKGTDSCLRGNDGSGHGSRFGGDESFDGSDSTFELKTTGYQKRINGFIMNVLDTNYPQSNKLVNALSYSLMSGGKRIRPLLSYATAEALGMDLAQADYVAASIEMIHAYSLIHDDLPAMDNDDLRRGKPTCHVEFDDATAILAGDALQAMAFEVLSHIDADPKIVVQLIRLLSLSCGVLGMAGGQSLDLESENKQLDKSSLDIIHQLKTGALISASVEMIGLLCTSCSDKSKLALKQYAYDFGMAFQIIDDVLDVIGDEATIGKPIGSDESNNKSTYPSIMGLDDSKKAALSHSQNAVAQLQILSGDSSYLKYLADYLVSRKS
ncbi:MAG: polyprenyl synthetase family protein [Proteobacteria bacterium]|nr:polyprenyl synthetase family protein [Pseudomonadota bacterium]